MDISQPYYLMPDKAFVLKTYDIKNLSKFREKPDTTSNFKNILFFLFYCSR